MFGPFVHCFQKRTQTLCKCDVAFAASEASSFLKISLAKTTYRTFLAESSLFNLVRCTKAKQQIGKRKARGVLYAFLFRASFAQIHLVHFAFQNLRQEDRRIITFANVAQHLC